MNTKKLKPFNLEAALSGKPVMLRDGRKAYVRHIETELPLPENLRLFGVAMREDVMSFRPINWTEKGRYTGDLTDYSEDIIGMYPETRIINGFEVPAPETAEPGHHADFYIASPVTGQFYRGDIWISCATDKIRLERGLVFLNKEDAIANAKAMLGINPNEEVEE